MIKTTNNHPELIEKLTEGIPQLVSSDKWQSYLDFQSKFYRCSYNNVLLISSQCKHATNVASFGAWKALGRNVVKGEKAIYIFASLVYKVSDENSDEETRIIPGFKFVPVFDVSQTEGEELPSICDRLVGSDPNNCYERLVVVADSLGFVVFDHSFSDSTNGDYNFEQSCIRVKVTISPAQRVKTLAHELAHAYLHKNEKNRSLAELEAESVAYIVCQMLGINSSDYTFGYVTTWAGSGDDAITSIKASCERIQFATCKMLHEMNENCKVASSL